MGAIILGSFTIISTTFLFFNEGTFSPLNLFMTLELFAKYPINIYSKNIQRVLTWCIPLAFVSFYPSAYLLNKFSITTSMLVIEIIISILNFLASIIFFNYGIKKYQGFSN